MRERTGNSAVRYDSKPSPRFFERSPPRSLFLCLSLRFLGRHHGNFILFLFFYGFPVPLETSHGMHHWIWFALQLMTDASKSTGFCVVATVTDRAGRVTNTVLACRVFLPTQPELSQAGHGRLPKKKKKRKTYITSARSRSL